MTITGEAPSRSDVVPPGELTGSVARRRPAVTLAGSAAVAAGTGLTYLVARAGEPPWQVVRALVVVALTVLVRKLLASGRGLPRSTTAFCAGAIAAPVGLAVAGPHLSKVGANPQSVAGAITAVAGLTLLVIGAVGLVRAARGWWRLPATTALLVLLYVTEPAITAAVAATNVPPTEVDTATPASLGMAYEDVTFPAADGTELSGWYVESANGAAVVLLHGAGSTRSAVLDHAAVLAGHGYGVLLYDARGHGRSGGQPMDFGWYGDEDVRGAVSFLQADPDVDPARIGAVGMSMGGEQAIGAMAGNDDLRAVVAEGATGRVAEDKAWYSSAVRDPREHPRRSRVVDHADHGRAHLRRPARPAACGCRGSCASSSLADRRGRGRRRR